MNDLLDEIRTFHRHSASTDSATFHSPWSSHRSSSPSDLRAAPRGRTSQDFTAPASRDESVALARDAYGFQYRTRPVPSAGGIYGLNLIVCDAGEALLDAATDRHGRVQSLDEAQLVSALGSNISGPFTAMIITAQLEDYVACYGTKGYRFALLEAGHVAQRVLESAATAGLRTASIGSFDETRLLSALGNPAQSVLHVLAVGR
jgi:hypothetical protein